MPSKKKPKPDPKPSPVVYTLSVDPALTGEIVRVTYDSGETAPMRGNALQVWRFDIAHPGWGCWLEIEAEGYVTQRIRGITPTKDGPSLVEPLPDRVTLQKHPTLSRLRVAGRHFVNEQQARVTICGASCFQAYDRYLRGDLDTAVFNQLEDEGFNGIRVFGMDHWIPLQMGRPPFTPQDFGDTYYARLPEFCGFAQACGLYVFFDVFADTGLLMPNMGEQQQHFSRVIEALKQAPNTLGSLGNELKQHENFVDKTKMPRPQGIAFSSGSEGMDDVPDPPHWDFACFHPRRDYPSAAKDCCVLDFPLYIQGHATMLDEPDRFGEDGNMNIEQAALQAGASVESSMGFVYHTKDGVYAQPFRPRALEGAREVIRVLRGV